MSSSEQVFVRDRVRPSLQRGAGIFYFHRRLNVDVHRSSSPVMAGGSRISSPVRVGESSPIAVEQEAVVQEAVEQVAVGDDRHVEQFRFSRLDGRARDKGKWIAHEMSDGVLQQSNSAGAMHARPLLADSCYSPVIAGSAHGPSIPAGLMGPGFKSSLSAGPSGPDQSPSSWAAATSPSLIIPPKPAHNLIHSETRLQYPIPALPDSCRVSLLSEGTIPKFGDALSLPCSQKSLSSSSCSPSVQSESQLFSVPVSLTADGSSLRRGRGRSRGGMCGRRGRQSLKRKVRSAYRAIMEVGDLSIASSSVVRPTIVDGWVQFWRRFWSVPVPPRVRLQVWRFCHDAVPTLANLQRRRPEIDQVCVHCGANVDSAKHILLECPFTKIVWALSNIPWHVLAIWPGETSEWMFGVFQQLSKEDQARFFTICWALWQQRNKVLMEGKSLEPIKVVEHANDFLSSYQDARRRQVLVYVVPRF
ncbi:hypothetical protein Salat_2538900 [Sesamum alatum]|uniref:Reverse transcriptase zinc-binding domain-containing protein n=1 Tax=Sesamum alatum TaxID=300844 RepID=A0AAE1XT72_9LAMI|nr:hypothetical protein Salat_2538900 [Sesamum alatum]